MFLFITKIMKVIDHKGPSSFPNCHTQQVTKWNNGNEWEKKVEIGAGRKKDNCRGLFGFWITVSVKRKLFVYRKKAIWRSKIPSLFLFFFFARASPLISLSFAAQPLQVLLISWLKRKLRDFSQSMKVKEVRQPLVYYTDNILSNFDPSHCVNTRPLIHR